MRKKALSLALALVLCLGLTVPAFAAELKIVEVPVPAVEGYENEDYDTGEFREGLAPFMTTKGVGFIDWTGKVVIPAEYETVWNFSEGFARVKKNEKIGYIDKAGKELTPLQYDAAGDFSNGMAAVEKGGKWGFIDKTGKEVIPCAYDDCYSFFQGLAAVKKGGKWGFIDKTGKEAVPFEYDEASRFAQGLAPVKKGVKWGFIDKTGETVIDFAYDGAGMFVNGLARVEQGGKYGFVDKTGELAIPCTFEWVLNFSEGLAPIRQNGKGGCIDTTGKIVIPCSKYTYIAPFSEGFAAVNVFGPQNLWGFIDKTGKEVVEPKLYTENGVKYGIFGWPGSESTFHDGSTPISRFLNEGSEDNFVPMVYFKLTVDAKVSDWAREQVDSAAVKGLMADCLGDDFTVNIPRAEFAAVAVELYEAMSGDTAPAPGENPFNDTTDPVVIQANTLGIVNGKGGGKFAPTDPVTRQEAALMLSRVYTKLGGEIPKVESTTFADNDKVSSWARDAVAFMSGKGIVNGKGNNSFDPLGNASIQEALIIALRMIEKLDVE